MSINFVILTLLLMLILGKQNQSIPWLGNACFATQVVGMAAPQTTVLQSAVDKNRDFVTCFGLHIWTCFLNENVHL